VGEPAPEAPLARFNRLPEEAARHELLRCCAAKRWAAELTAARPYADAEQLYAAADRALAELTDAELAQALAGHPRIGDRRAGDATAMREQSGVVRADEPVRAALVEANQRYEERFGHVYLVAASGRGAEELLADLRARMANDAASERAVLRRELAKINRIRLRGLVRG